MSLLADRMMVEQVADLRRGFMSHLRQTLDRMESAVESAGKAVDARDVKAARRHIAATHSCEGELDRYRHRLHEWWRDRLIEAERFEVTPVMQMFGNPEEWPSKLLDPAVIPAIRLPYSPCWVEGHVDADLLLGGLMVQEVDAVAVTAVAVASDGQLALVGTFRLRDGTAQRHWEIAPDTKPEGEDPFMAHGEAMASMLLYGITLLSCKNIGTTERVPSRVQRKERARQYKPALFTFKVLTVRVGGEWRPIEDAVPTGQHGVRLHGVRGHFKHFTTDRPLMGRHVGVYWWNPHARGDKALGAVEKEYVLEPEPVA